MRKRISERKLNELRKVIENKQLAEIPFIRFITPGKREMNIRDFFQNSIGKLIKIEDYKVKEKPENEATITIIEDI